MWGAIASGFLSIITSIATGALKRKAELEKSIADFKEKQIETEKQINLLIVERLKIQAEADNAFLNEIAKRIEGYQKAAAAAKAGLDALYSQTEYKWEGKIYEGIEAVKGLMVKSIPLYIDPQGRKVFGNLASFDIWSDTTRTSFDTKKLEAFILKLGEGDKALKEYLKSILELQKEYENAVQAAAEVLSSSFDNLGSSVIDAITQSIENGTNAWGAFKESAADALKSVVANMLYTVYMSSKMQKLKENLESIAKGIYATEGIANVIADYFERLESKTWFDALRQLHVVYKNDDIWKRGRWSYKHLVRCNKGASQKALIYLQDNQRVRLNQVEALSLSRSQLFRLVSIDSGVQMYKL